jgi:pimeloyl-ACP methyl ester carboxylesterase
MTANQPALVFLHGIGDGDSRRSWRSPLDETLRELGYPDLDGTTVITPVYADLLRTADHPKARPPRFTTPKPSSRESGEARWAHERRQAALEEQLGRSRSGIRIGLTEDAVDFNVNWVPLFAQAKRYLRNADLRALILNRVIESLPESGDVVLIGHSLGSLVAVDLLDVLPERLRVKRLVTLGSPLGYPSLLRHRKVLLDRFPYGRVESWVNIWNERDPVSLGRGVSHHFPEALDIKITSGLAGHAASVFVRSQVVAKAIGSGLFGPLGREISPVEMSLSEHLDPLEMLLVLRVAYGHYLVDAQEEQKRSRLEAAFSIVQQQLVENLVEQYAEKQQAVPGALLELRHGDRPYAVARLGPEDSLIPLLLICASNSLAPFEIETSATSRRKAMGDLSVFLGLTSSHGERVFDALEEAHQVIRDSHDATARWLLGAAGVALLVAGPVGWALAAPAGLAGGAAIVGGLAAFGPGGLVGGLVTAGALTSAGTGATVAALVGAQSPAMVVESTVAQLLAVAVARRRLKLPVEDSVWFTLVDLHTEIVRELQHLSPYSDRSSPSIKTLEAKRAAVERALKHLLDKGYIDPVDLDGELDEAGLAELEERLAEPALTGGAADSTEA